MFCREVGKICFCFSLNLNGRIIHKSPIKSIGSFHLFDLYLKIENLEYLQNNCENNFKNNIQSISKFIIAEEGMNDTNSMNCREKMNLDQGLKQFSTKEILSGSNQWRCEKCQVHRDAQKQIEIWTSPNILILQLLRFNESQQKIDVHVNFPLNQLDFRNYMAKNHSNEPHLSSSNYECFAIINHKGRTLHHGHYIVL